METILWMSSVAGAAFMSLAVRRLVARYQRSRGAWLVDCPETQSCADISIALASRLGDSPRVQDCSHWPERAGCDQSCVRG